ncbi:MAG: phosphoribosyltransferase family protein, partial [Anaerolineae bacterium]|nr:phosphoribosyltransferase family protein [Thermoflexales bacterium]MDW8406272.1 phosphoribosyltransferase family protein [Anaerolineae bacterium]
LQDWADRNDVIVLGIPRGGVIVAAEIAARLHAPLDVFLTHKLGAPGNPELAIGAVADDGTTLLDEQLIETLGISDQHIQRERDTQLRLMQARAARYRQGRPPPDVSGRCVIVCDDGIATGATALAALECLRRRQPTWLILAVPVAPPQSVARLSTACDEIVTLATPDPFYAVGRFYQRFEQVSDEQVIAALEQYSHGAQNDLFGEGDGDEG